MSLNTVRAFLIVAAIGLVSPSLAHDPTTASVPLILRYDNPCMVQHDTELHVAEDRLRHPFIIRCENGAFVIVDPEESK